MPDTQGTPVEGQEFILKIGDNKVMGTISRTLNFSAEEKDNTTMDSDAGWSSTKSGKKSFDLSVELQFQKAASYNGKELFQAFLDGVEAVLYFGGVNEGDMYFEGNVWVSGGSISTPGNGQNMGMSANLKGTGALAPKTVASV